MDINAVFVYVQCFQSYIKNTTPVVLMQEVQSFHLLMLEPLFLHTMLHTVTKVDDQTCFEGKVIIFYCHVDLIKILSL